MSPEKRFHHGGRLYFTDKDGKRKRWIGDESSGRPATEEEKEILSDQQPELSSSDSPEKEVTENDQRET